jgi:hypothetical protein
MVDGPVPPFEPGPRHDMHRVPPLFPERRRQYRDFGYRSQASTLLIQIFDAIPGTFMVCLFYILALRLAYRLESSFSRRRVSKEALGYASGNYGQPVDQMRFLKQTILLTLCSLIVKFAIWKSCEHHPEGFMNLTDGLFGSARDMNPKLRWFLFVMLGPYMLFSVQFVFTDYVIKRRSGRRGASSARRGFLPLNEAHELDTGMPEVSDDEEEGYQLQDLSVPIPVSVDIEQQQIPLPLSRPVSGPAEVNIVSRSFVGLISPSPVDAAGAVAESSTHPTLGIVTASLLNAAAVLSTASQRSELFNAPSCGSSSALPDTNEDDGLPSYDDSQREQMHLRSSDPTRAQQRDLLIAELKR